MDTVREFFRYTKNPEEYGYKGFRPLYNYVPYARKVLSPAMGAIHLVGIIHYYSIGKKPLSDVIFMVTPLSIAKSALMLLVPVYTGWGFLTLLFAVDVALFALAPAKVIPGRKEKTPEGFFKELSKKLPPPPAVMLLRKALSNQGEELECKGVAPISDPKEAFLDYIEACDTISVNYLSNEENLSEFVTEKNFGHIPPEWIEAIPERYTLFKAHLKGISKKMELHFKQKDFLDLVTKKDGLKELFANSKENGPLFVGLFVDFYSPQKEDFGFKREFFSFIFKLDDFWQQVPAEWLYRLLSTSPRAFFQLTETIEDKIKGNFKGSLRKAYNQFLENHQWIKDSPHVSMQRVGGDYSSKEDEVDFGSLSGDETAYVIDVHENGRRLSVDSSEELEDAMVVKKSSVGSFLKILNRRKKERDCIKLPFEKNTEITSLRAIEVSREEDLP